MTDADHPHRARLTEQAQSHLAEAQTHLSEAQARIAAQAHTHLADAQARLAEAQAALGEQAARVGEEVRRVRHRVGLPPGFNLAGAARHRFWRSVFQLVGGFRVTGSAPYQAMVVAANHQSHADTAALLAAMPAPYKPVVVAADDYWFDSALRRTLLSLATGGVPVDRVSGGGYASLVAGAEKVLGAGSTLLVFPEGTRSTDGTLGPLHSGAMRIAQEFEVPLLPIALVGTGALLPKRGRLHPAAVEVRVGTAIAPQDLVSMDQVADQLRELLDRGPAVPGVSRTWQALHRFMAGPGGPIGAFAWSFAEALSWPITSEAYLLFVGAANPRRIPAAVAMQALGSTAGVLVHGALVRRGRRPPMPWTAPAMHEAAAEHLGAGARGMWRQALNGVPVKVYARAAAEAGLARAPLAGHTLAARGARAVGLGAAIAAGAWAGRRVLERAYGPYLTASTATYVAGLAAVVHRWRRR